MKNKIFNIKGLNMISVERQYNTGYLKKILIMFFAAFLVLATCNNIYAEDNNDLKFIETACKIYNGFNPILSVIILVVVITTAVAALFGKLSMAVVVTVMVTAIVIKQAPQIVRLVTDDKPYSVHVRITATTIK